MTEAFFRAIFALNYQKLFALMRWKIRHFTFCERKQTLADENTRTQLEPLLVEVLSYFCRHPGEMISREKLVEEVWQSRIITDNAVNRVIAKLRKQLGDDPRAPRFIATFPKKGYKWIAPLKEYPQAPVSLDSEQSKNSSYKLSTSISFVGVTFVGLFLLWFWHQSSSTRSLATAHNKPYKVAALTRGGGFEFAPAISPNGEYLTYAEIIDGKMRLFLKHLDSEKVVEIGQKRGWSGPASWSKDGRQIVYLSTTQDSCRYHLLQVNGLKVISKRVIHNCPVGSAGKIIFTHNPRQLIYAESKGRYQPYEIFLLDLDTAEKKRLQQPPLVKGGNGEFNLHPTKNLLLVSSPDEQQWLVFYKLNIDQDELTYMFKLNEYLCCAIWSHDADRVVVMGEHPAYQIVSYDLKGKNRAVVYETQQIVKTPHRFANQKDYMYVGSNNNDDIFQLSLDTNKVTEIVQSSVSDRLATVSNDGKQLAYVSIKTGHEEIWIRSLTNSEDLKLTRFQDNRRYYDLKWSPDNRWIAAMAINELHIINAVSGEYSRVKIPQTEIRAVSWLDKQTISYSLKQDIADNSNLPQWRNYHYNLSNQQAKANSRRWRYIQYANNPRDTLWVDQQNQVYWGQSQQIIQLPIEHMFYGRRFTLNKHQQHIFSLVFEERDMLLKLTSVENGESATLVNAASDYSVYKGELYYTSSVSQSADIFRTVSD